MFDQPVPNEHHQFSYTFSEAVFTPEECQKIIDDFGQGLKDASVGGAPGGVVDLSIRRSGVVWIHFEERSRWIYERLERIAVSTNERFFGFELAGNHEPLQLTYYDGAKEGHYDWHMDFGKGAFRKRKLSQVVPLSPDGSYEGGEFEMDGAGAIPEAKQGNVVNFPSFWRHRVKPVTKGERWSLVAWVWGTQPYR